MARFALLAILCAACGRSPASSPPATLPLSVVAAAPLADGALVTVDGKGEDAAWSAATETVVPLTGPGPSEIRLRALYDRERFYLLARWSDSQASYGRYWKLDTSGNWERFRGEDGFSLLIAPGTHTGEFLQQGCAMVCHDNRHVREEGEGFADIWYWGSERTNPLAQAIDMVLHFGTKFTLRGDTQPANSGLILNESTEFRGPGWVPRRVSEGTTRILTSDNTQPLTKRQLLALSRNEGWEVPCDILRRMAGSRGDVVASGLHGGQGWTLEMSRALRTGESDDLPLGDPLVPARIGVALYDGREGAEHAVSGPIELRFLPRR